MKNSLALMLLLQAALIGLNAVFACAEIAVISMNDTRLARLAAWAAPSRPKTSPTGWSSGS